MRFLLLIVACCNIASIFAQPINKEDQDVLALRSPGAQILARIELTPEGAMQYTVLNRGKMIVKTSKISFSYAEFSKDVQIIGTKHRTGKGLTLLKIDSVRVNTTWAPVLGEVDSIQNRYNQFTYLVSDLAGAEILFTFRVYDTGLAFKYEMLKAPNNAGRIVLLTEETEFKMAKDHTAWWLPGDYDTNEYEYSNTRLSAINTYAASAKNAIVTRAVIDSFAVQTPLMMKSDSGSYINIHEAALINFPAMHLELNPQKLIFKTVLTPNPHGYAAYLDVPFSSPWRVVQVSSTATDLLDSKMILNLNAPSVIKDVSWIKPCKYVGVWWEMHVGKSSWNYYNRENGALVPNTTHGANTANVKRFIDFAAQHKFDGVLVEGWNTGWEDWFGVLKDKVFDFVTPYPDFDVAAISAYAKSKNVKLIMHHETSSSVNNYNLKIDTAYKFMHRYGYDMIKSGYVGRILPLREYHDGQFMVNHYAEVAARCAKEKFLIDMHESVRPTGLHRTFPNWVSNEAARGTEFHNSEGDGIACDHETILPFTRLMGGPMDYTPGIFDLDVQRFDARRKAKVHSTLAKQLALYVTIYSPLQMACDLPESYEKHLDAFQFIKDVALDWSDTKYLAAEPGDFIVVARKAKGKRDWYLGGTTDEQARKMEVALDFLDPGKSYEATIYADAPTANWENNPEAYVITKRKVNAESKIVLNMAAGGGVAISFTPL